MSSYQRRRGQIVKVYRSVLSTDNRGNKVFLSDADGPHEVKAAIIPQRSARAEVPGQTQINILRLIIEPNLEDVNLWSTVEYAGRFWDIVTPPALHYGERMTRHWSVDIRERPSG